MSWSGKILKRLTAIRAALREIRYKRQGLKKVPCADYQILTPEKHTLIRYQDIQPYRNLCIGISAAVMAEKYPDGIIVDVGANIGDTAAIIASYTNNDLVLVEPDNYFFDILKKNSELLPNNTRLLQTLVANGEDFSGGFSHWGGTAKFQANESSHTQNSSKPILKSIRLGDIAGDRTCLVKIDTDGFDYKIILESLDWLSTSRPAVLFENEIRTTDEYRQANRVFEALYEIGYSQYIVWDDPGVRLLSTTSLSTALELNHYLWRTWQGDGRRSIFNYNVLALHEQDGDVFQAVSDIYENCDHKQLLARSLTRKADSPSSH